MTEQRPFLPHYRTTLRQELLCALAIAISLLISRYSALQTLDERYLGGAVGDPGLYIWLTKFGLNSLAASSWFTTSAFYPYGGSLAWSDNYIAPSFLVQLLAALGHALSYNLSLLLAQALLGYFTYRLAFALTGCAWSSLFAGAAIVGSPYLTAHLGHPQLQWAFAMPAAFIGALSFMRTKSFLSALSVGLVLGLSFLCSIYCTIFAALGVAFLAIFTVAIRPTAFSFRNVVYFILAVGLGVTPAIPFILPYFEVQRVFGERELYETYYFAADAQSYLKVSAISLLSKFLPSSADEEHNLFPGLIILCLATIPLFRLAPSRKLYFSAVITVLSVTLAIVISLLESSLHLPALRIPLCIALWLSLLTLCMHMLNLSRLEARLGFTILTDRDIVGLIAFMGLLFAVISFGPLGNPSRGEYTLSPHALLYHVVPGLNALRAICRAGFYLQLFCVLLSAFTFARYLNLKWRRGAVICACVLVSLENQPHYIPSEALQEAPVSISYLAKVPPESAPPIIISLPFAPILTSNGEVASWGSFARTNTLTTDWANSYGAITVNGYSGIRTKLMRDLPRELQGFPDKRSLLALRKIAGLSYVSVHPALFPAFDAAKFEDQLSALSNELEVLSRDTTGDMLLRIIGSRQLEEYSPLLTPGAPNAHLQIVLRAESSPASFSIFDDDNVPGIALFEGSLSKFEKKSFDINLDKGGNSIRPRRVRMVSSPAGAIFVDGVAHLSN